MAIYDEFWQTPRGIVLWRFKTARANASPILIKFRNESAREHLFRRLAPIALRTGNRISECSKNALYFGDERERTFLEITPQRRSIITLGSVFVRSRNNDIRWKHRSYRLLTRRRHTALYHESVRPIAQCTIDIPTVLSPNIRKNAYATVAESDKCVRSGDIDGQQRKESVWF